MTIEEEILVNYLRNYEVAAVMVPENRLPVAAAVPENGLPVVAVVPENGLPVAAVVPALTTFNPV